MRRNNGQAQQTKHAARTTAALGRHVAELTSHTLDVADYSGHGHAIGRQGVHGHLMPKSDAHKQAGAFVPQDMYRNRTKDYGALGTSFNSQGAFGTSGTADYQTTNVGETGDADSAGPTGF